MKILQLFTGSVVATLTMGLFTAANAADRLEPGIRRVPASIAQPNTAAARTFRIAGTALDADGKPVPGAVVECYQNPSIVVPFAPVDMEVKQSVTTGTNGSFELQVSPVSAVLIGRKPGLALAWNQYWNLTKDMTEERLIFTPPTTIKGVVVDEADKPVADAAVSLFYACIVRDKEEGRMSYAYLNGKPARDHFSARTAADGKFVIQGFPTNAAADLAVSKSGKVLRELQRRGISPDSMRYQPGQPDVKLVVEPAGSIEGKVVVQGTSQPLADAGIWPQASRPGVFSGGPREPARSGADGAFRLPDLAAGSYQLHASFGTNRLPEWVAEIVTVSVESGQTTRDVQVSAMRGGFLEVAVVGRDDRRPVGGVGINAFKKGYQGGGSSGTNGLGLLRLPPGEYQVSAHKDNTRSEGHSATVETDHTNHIEIELNPPPKIAGVVRDPSGAPVAGLALSVFPNWGQSTGGTRTDAKGHYEMSWNPQRFGPADGGSCLVVRDLERNLASARDIEESTTTLDFSLEAGLTVLGRVEDVNSKPLSNATVRLFLWSGNSGSQFGDQPIRTDAQGRFEISAMPPGRKYSLDATAKGYGSANQSIQEDAGTNRIELEPCVLKVADHKLAGEVVDAEEKPAVRVSVYMYGEGQPNGSVRTDANGRFRFDAVCEGTVQLSASAENSFSGTARAEAGDTNVVIRLGVNQSYSVRETPKRPSLKGKPLPDLAAMELGDDAAPAGKPVLLCLVDVDQRPSRRFLKQLAEQHDALRQKGLTVLGLQAVITTVESFKEWKGSNPVPFPIGRLAEKVDKTKWALEAESFPWLILADADRHVIDEGFALEELEAKLNGLTR